MNPLNILLSSLAILPAAVIIALLVNLVGASLIETLHTARVMPKARSKR